MRRLTTIQKKVANFIKEQRLRYGISPTHDEIKLHFGWKSAYSVRQHLDLIEKKGEMTRIRGKARAIRVAEEPFHGIPVLGAIPAGPIMEAIQETEVVLPVPPGYFRGVELFALRVKGDSMKCAGIHDGDFAIMDHQPEVHHGEIAAVLLNNETTLKRVLFTPNGLILKAENPNYSDRCIPPSEAEECRIAGRLVGIIRRYL